jgi:hypothetical protein
MPDLPPTPPNASAPSPRLNEVRYSLTDMLAEIQLERSESSFGMETLDQVEIQKMFANRRRRHVRQKE